MHKSVSNAARLVALVSLLVVSGCAGSSDHMRNVEPAQASFGIESEKALIVFMRPSGLGFAIQSSVFDVTDGNPKFIGIVSAKTKVAHYAEPGDRRYMVVSESADFMGATVDAGKAYYALVTPRMGVWKARFSLRPVHAGELQTDQFAEWYGDTRWVENTESSSAWARDNMSSILSKMADNLPKWEAKPDQPILYSTDGLEAPYASPG